MSGNRDNRRPECCKNKEKIHKENFETLISSIPLEVPAIEAPRLPRAEHKNNAKLLVDYESFADVYRTGEGVPNDAPECKENDVSFQGHPLQFIQKAMVYSEENDNSERAMVHIPGNHETHSSFILSKKRISDKRVNVPIVNHVKTFLPVKRIGDHDHYYYTSPKHGDWFAAYMNSKCVGRQLHFSPEALYEARYAAGEYGQRLLKKELYKLFTDNVNLKDAPIGTILEVEGGDSHFVDYKWSLDVKLQLHGNYERNDWNNLLKDNVHLFPDSKRGIVILRISVANLRSDGFYISSGRENGRRTELLPNALNVLFTPNVFLGGSGQHLALADILLHFETWEQLQFSCALGGCWDGDKLADSMKLVGLTSEVVNEFRDFVLGHDWDRVTNMFVAREFGISKATPEQKVTFSELPMSAADKFSDKLSRADNKIESGRYPIDYLPSIDEHHANSALKKLAGNPFRFAGKSKYCPNEQRVFVRTNDSEDVLAY